MTNKFRKTLESLFFSGIVALGPFILLEGMIYSIQPEKREFVVTETREYLGKNICCGYNLFVDEKKITLDLSPSAFRPYGIISDDGDLIPDYVKIGFVASVRFAELRKREPTQEEKNLFSKVVSKSKMFGGENEKSKI